MLSSDDEAPRFGYLLILEDSRHGWTGACLVVSDLGRPIEFHCTEPVLPSRAEEILFGKTLRSHLVGDRIVPALFERLECPIDLLLTREIESAATADRYDFKSIVLSEQDSALPLSCDADIKRLLMLLSEAIDPYEPFERVREAILEAHRVGCEGNLDDLAA